MSCLVLKILDKSLDGTIPDNGVAISESSHLEKVHSSHNYRLAV